MGVQREPDHSADGDEQDPLEEIRRLFERYRAISRGVTAASAHRAAEDPAEAAEDTRVLVHH